MPSLTTPATRPRFFLWRFIDYLHARLWARLFIWGLRLLLSVGFILPAVSKALGYRFWGTSENTGLQLQGTFETNPIGYFFEAMYQTGFYWQFIGLMQITGAALLLVPRLRTLGGLVYFVIISNIMVITWSMGFGGTPYVTTLMWLGVLALLLWDYPRLLPLIGPLERR